MYDVFARLMKAKGCTAYQVSKATGIAQSTLSDWKSGKSTPKSDKIKLLAEYFGVTPEYLMTGKNPEPKQGYYLNDETAAIAQEIFENKELRMLFDASRNATPEDLLTVRDMMLALKRKERGDMD